MLRRGTQLAYQPPAPAASRFLSAGWRDRGNRRPLRATLKPSLANDDVPRGHGKCNTRSSARARSCSSLPPHRGSARTELASAAMPLDLEPILAFSVSPWEMVLRGTLMYWFLLALFRVVVRRRAGAVGISDLLLLVIIADAAQ